MPRTSWVIDFFWRYNWFDNPEIWLTENSLSHNSTKIIFTDIYRICAGRANNMKFHFTSNLEKNVQTKAFGKTWKTKKQKYFWLFWAFFGYLRGKTNFFEKLGFVSFYSLKSSAIMQKIRKTNEWLPRKTSNWMTSKQACGWRNRPFIS